MSKVCTKCNIEREALSFSKGNDKDGLNYRYRQCEEDYRRQPDKHFRTAYRNIKHRLRCSPNYMQRKLHFTWDEFQVIKGDYFKVHHVWREAGYPRTLTPSIDRIDNGKDYSLDNIQVLTSGDNTAKDQRGEKTNFAVLTKEDVSTVKKLVALGGYTQAAIGKLFNVNQSTICRIINGQNWSHLT